MLKVLLDARKFGDGGIGVYLSNLIQGYRGLIRKAGKAGEEAPLQLSLLVKPENKEYNSRFSGFEQIACKSGLYSLGEMFMLSSKVVFSRYDVAHFPHYTLPHWIPIPTVVTIHDTIHLSHPPKPWHPFIARPMIKSALSRAHSVITVSEASKLELLKLSSKTNDLMAKLSVIPNSLRKEFVNVEGISSEALSSKFNFILPYILSVCSTLKPHKGILDLLKAYRALSEREEIPNLIVVGQAFENIQAAKGLAALIRRELETLPKVTVIGKVTDSELLGFYQNAQYLIVPSLAEGFCLPALEAKAQGTPVVARPIPALKEILSDRDVICEDFSVQSLVAGIEKLNSNKDAKVDRAQAAAELMKLYDPEIQAAKTLEVYKKLA